MIFRLWRRVTIYVIGTGCALYTLSGLLSVVVYFHRGGLDIETVHVDRATVPFSIYASAEARRAFAEIINNQPPVELMLSIEASRRYFDSESERLLDRMQNRYPVNIEQRSYNGVIAEVITPESGIAEGNEQRVLINLHGGSFMWGSVVASRLESIPIASVMGIKVVGVDYRLAPEFKFPAAHDDIIAVYKSLLETYSANKIGIYGCSAGAILTAQVIAILAQQGVPLPGAAGIFCGAGGDMYGDSWYFAYPLVGRSSIDLGGLDFHVFDAPYYHGTDENDQRLSPVLYPEILEVFPPTLFISGTRDWALSSALNHNNKLALAGVETRFHTWDGLWHAFFYDADIPESREMYNIVADSFDHWLH